MFQVLISLWFRGLSYFCLLTSDKEGQGTGGCSWSCFSGFDTCLGGGKVVVSPE